MDNIWETDKPFYEDEKSGRKWFLDKFVTDYCSSDLNGLPALDATCFVVVQKGLPEAYVLINNKTNKIITTSTSLEAIGCAINAQRLSFSFEN